MQSSSPDLVLGDPVLDADHAELHRLALQLQAAPAAQVAEVVQALRDHSGAHFAREDEDIRKQGGPNATCHLDEHAAVLKSLAEVLVLLGDPATPVENVERIRSGLSQELLRWLPEHVSQMDASVATGRTQERLGGAPVKITRRLGG